MEPAWINRTGRKQPASRKLDVPEEIEKRTANKRNEVNSRICKEEKKKRREAAKNIYSIHTNLQRVDNGRQ